MREYEKAWHVFRESNIHGFLQPDEVTYSVMINCCAQVKQSSFWDLNFFFKKKEGLVEKALNLLSEMESNGLRPTEVTFNSILLACSKRKDILFFKKNNNNN